MRQNRLLALAGIASSVVLSLSATAHAQLRVVNYNLAKLAGDAASIRAFGLDVITRLCERLLAGGAPGLHFYALNQSELVLEIGKRLGLTAPASSA